MISNVSGSSSKWAMAMFDGENDQNSSFLPPSLDSDVITDTIRSFFPIGGAAGEASSSTIQFQNFSTHDLLSRNINNNNNSQNLKLSLQSFQDPNFLHHHHTSPHTNPIHHSEQQARAQGQHVLPSGTPLEFDGWPPPQDHHQPASELSRLQRFAPWNSGSDNAISAAASTAGFLFNSPAAAAQHLFGGHQDQFFTTSQRGPLQSSNTPSLRWMDPSAAITISMADQHHHAGALPVYPSSFSGGIGFASGYGGFSGFHIPSRIQVDEEEHNGYSDKPSSASFDSRH